MPLAVGGLSAFITRNSFEQFSEINQPALSPPGWLFPVVWTVLYILMGIASYLVISSEKNSRPALIFYGLQLLFNFIWSPIFFNLQNYLLAFIVLVILWILVVITTVMFYKISKPAGYLMIPYILWITFAGYLNLAIYLIN